MDYQYTPVAQEIPNLAAIEHHEPNPSLCTPLPPNLSLPPQQIPRGETPPPPPLQQYQFPLHIDDYAMVEAVIQAEQMQEVRKQGLPRPYSGASKLVQESRQGSPEVLTELPDTPAAPKPNLGPPLPLNPGPDLESMGWTLELLGILPPQATGSTSGREKTRTTKQKRKRKLWRISWHIKTWTSLWMH